MEANAIAVENIIATQEADSDDNIVKKPKNLKTSWKKDFKQNWQLYLIFLIPAAYFIVFHYVPMAGIFMAFEEYSLAKGLFGSEWIGFDNFKELFSGEAFPLALRNTCIMALLNLTIGFIAPVLLGILVSQVKSKRFSRVIQTVTYMPYFVSAVVCCTLAQEFLNDNGAITALLGWFGIPKQNLLAINGPSFWFINTFLNIWQMAGYSSIIYITTISAINRDLYDAAAIDGASRWRMIRSITLPSILPIIIMMFTMQIGLVFKQGFDKVLLLYMPTTYEFSDVLYTYTYRMAFTGSHAYGLSTASGLFQSVIGMILLLFGNWLSNKLAKTSMF